MIRLVNNCSEFLGFTVPSESKRGDYDILISKHDGWVNCNCNDCQMRGKGDWFFVLLDGGSLYACKHMARLFTLIRRLFDKEQGKLL